MTGTDEGASKRFMNSAQTGLRGESFLEVLLSRWALPHRIVAPKDLGLDLLCEWVAGERPNGTLFGVQVKTTARESIRARSIGLDDKLNLLERFEFTGFPTRIDEPTRQYWRGLGIPIYLFLVVDGGEQLTAYYRRFTAELTGASKDGSGANQYYRVSDGQQFLAFANSDRVGGFARDLFIDTVRCLYSRGLLAYPDPASFGLRQFWADGVFDELVAEYRDQIVGVLGRTQAILEHLDRAKLPNTPKGGHQQ